MCSQILIIMEQINAIARGQNRTVRKIADMTVNQHYRIEALKKVTTVYGEKIILDLENDEFCYLPTRVSSLLLDNDEAGYKAFQTNLEENNVSIVRLPGKLGRSWPIEFITTARGNGAIE